MILNMILLILSVAMMVSIFCRLNLMEWKRHKSSVILFNVCLVGAVGSVAQHAWLNEVDLQDWAILVACGCWIWLSYATWKDGPPRYIERNAR